MNMIKKGFTLIELMIVVAIVGILAAIALPVYQDYIARSQVSEAVAGASAVKTGITEYYASQGDTAYGTQFDVTADAGRYTDSLIAAATGVVTVTLRPIAPVSNLIRGKTLTLTPYCDANKAIAAWQCDVGTLLLKHLPSGCQNRPATVVACGF